MAQIFIAVFIAVAITGCSISESRNPDVTTTEETNRTETSGLDTLAVISNFRTAFSLPDSLPLTLTKTIVGPDVEKYELLAEMQGIREEIRRWNQQIAGLQYRFESGMSMMMPTWDADVQDHADASIHINNLMLEYDKIVERLVEGDFSGSGTFYEAKTGKSTFWIFEGSDGALTKKLKRR